jgi:hypothetical protein
LIPDEGCTTFPRSVFWSECGGRSVDVFECSSLNRDREITVRGLTIADAAPRLVRLRRACEKMSCRLLR